MFGPPLCGGQQIEHRGRAEIVIAVARTRGTMRNFVQRPAALTVDRA
jgi:hypothetical protein